MSSLVSRKTHCVHGHEFTPENTLPEGGKRKCRTCKRQRNRRYPERRAARRAVQSARERGELVRPTTCERCDVLCTPVAHHDDYEAPLDVRWLCRPCHHDVHKEGKADTDG